jgi:hypothetical protein
MKSHLIPRLSTLVAAVILTLVFAGSVRADDHNYQVTGPILAVTDTSITVKKGSAPWTVSRDAGTVITGDLTVGSKVTIKYHMVADSVTAKAAK